MFLSRTPEDLLRAFIAADVRFLIVGAYALALHGKPRATGHLDVRIDATSENAARVILALTEFGAPMTDVSLDDFSREGVTYQIGSLCRPPGRQSPAPSQAPTLSSVSSA